MPSGPSLIHVEPPSAPPSPSDEWMIQDPWHPDGEVDDEMDEIEEMVMHLSDVPEWAFYYL